MSHMRLEMGHRGIPATDFRHGPERLAAAARRLGLPPEIVSWFQTNMGRAV